MVRLQIPSTLRPELGGLAGWLATVWGLLVRLTGHPTWMDAAELPPGTVKLEIFEHHKQYLVISELGKNYAIDFGQVTQTQRR